MRKQLLFDDGNFAQIEFFKNQGAQIIMDYVSRFTFAAHIHRIIPIQEHSLDAEAKLKNYFYRIQDLGFNIPIDFEVDITQDRLNLYHRFFTDNATWAHTYQYTKNNPVNPYDRSFTIEMIPSYEEWLDLIHGINTEVHKLEMSMQTEQKKFVINSGLNFNLIDIRCNGNDIHDIRWQEFIDHDPEFTYTENYADVLLAEEIQGKSYLRAFLDDDDPRNPDISGRTGTFGGFYIDLAQKRREIYQSVEFKQWLGFYNLNFKDIPLEYPVGKVQEMSFDENSEMIEKIDLQIQ